ncbi:MAG: hypothetical protein ACJ8EB_10420 [Allosphingosinicella sp.]
MFDGTRLQLMIGPAPAPVPAPLPVIEALQSVEVTRARGTCGFNLTFALGKDSPLQLAMLPAGFFDPVVTRVVIAVIHRGLPHVLMDGIVTNQSLQPGNDPGKSTLTLTGEDLSLLMNLIEVTIPWPAMPDMARIAVILAKYAAFGMVPLIIPPGVFSVDSPTSRHDTQETTDRDYIRELAAQNGYVFAIEPGPVPGQSIAYFGPDYRLPVLQPALNVNMDADTNVESLSFTLDGLAKKITIMRILDSVTKKIPIPIPIPNISPVHPPLGLRPTPPARITATKDTARLSPSEAAKRALGIVMQSADAISGHGSLNVASYGSVLKPNMMVGVRGAGTAYDGPYYVDSVTHNLKPGEYKQSFTLSRDGLMAPAPAVVP